MGRSRYQFLPNHPHFLTCTVINWLPLFSKPDCVDILFASLKFLQQQKRLSIHAYVVMENHLHLIASAPDSNLSKEIGHFKSFTARSIVDRLKETGSTYWLEQLALHKRDHKADQQHQVWQEGSHPQAISTSAMLVQKLAYIHHNPVDRGYVDDPAHWRYSSYRNYLGEEGLLAIELLEC